MKIENNLANNPFFEITTEINFNQLPKDLHLVIFSFLPAREAGRLSRICKYWNAFCNESFLWKQFLFRDFPKAMIATSAKDTYRENFFEEKRLQNRKQSHDFVYKKIRLTSKEYLRKYKK